VNSVLISFTQQFVFCVSELRLFLESQHCCIADCPVIRLFSFHLATEFITVRLE